MIKIILQKMIASKLICGTHNQINAFKSLTIF